jgi:hypothetical protein
VQQLLAECRKNFGMPGRAFSLWDRLTYLRTGRPAWCDRSDRLGLFFENRNDLLKHGQVVWGHIVQANVALFSSGLFDSAANIVFPSDPSVVIDPAELAEVAERLFELKDTVPGDRQLATLAKHLSDEFDRAFGMPVPNSLSPKFQSLMSSSVVARRHLPQRRLCFPLLPIIVSPRTPKTIMPLPSRYWPDELVEWWTDQ